MNIKYLAMLFALVLVASQGCSFRAGFSVGQSSQTEKTEIANVEQGEGDN